MSECADCLTAQVAHSGLATIEPRGHALARSYQRVQNQASSLAYIDAYMLLAIGSAIVFHLSFTLRNNVLIGKHE